jgi:hypothetical protein
MFITQIQLLGEFLRLDSHIQCLIITALVLESIELLLYLIEVLHLIGRKLIKLINGPNPLPILILLRQERINNTLIPLQHLQRLLKHLPRSRFGRIGKVQSIMQPAHIIRLVDLDLPVLGVFVGYVDFVS